ncbi:hypothetical protein FIM08_01955 [SAR202 cluster bacterium AC-647-N09_OGT_505m]|nr:hypothetical protein [SAR202 cluster bacterium AC-647-N09_OGT_505m]
MADEQIKQSEAGDIFSGFISQIKALCELTEMYRGSIASNLTSALDDLLVGRHKWDPDVQFKRISDQISAVDIGRNANFVHLFSLFERFMSNISQEAIRVDPEAARRYISMFEDFAEEQMVKRVSGDWKRFFNRPDVMIEDYALLEKEKGQLPLTRVLLGMEMGKLPDFMKVAWGHYIEMRERRNLLTHRGVIPDDIYYKALSWDRALGQNSKNFLEEKVFIDDWLILISYPESKGRHKQSREAPVNLSITDSYFEHALGMLALLATYFYCSGFMLKGYQKELGLRRKNGDPNKNIPIDLNGLLTTAHSTEHFDLVLICLDLYSAYFGGYSEEEFHLVVHELDKITFALGYEWAKETKRTSSDPKLYESIDLENSYGYHFDLSYESITNHHTGYARDLFLAHIHRDLDTFIEITIENLELGLLNNEFIQDSFIFRAFYMDTDRFRDAVRECLARFYTETLESDNQRDAITNLNIASDHVK